MYLKLKKLYLFVINKNSMEQLIKTLFISLFLSFGINFEIIAQESKLVTKINKQKAYIDSIYQDDKSRDNKNFQ